MKRRITLLIAVLVLVSTGLTGCSSTPSSENTGEFLDNSLITAKVKTKLVDDRITSGSHISVYTNKGVVHLSGEVNSEYERQYASKIALDVSGVKQVENKLVVRSD